MSDNFFEDLEAGNEYLDFLSPYLMQEGIIFCPHLSKKYQKEKGESVNGVEVKYDRILSKTHNLFIETAFNSKPSGINYGGKMWLYCIGDYDRCFIFAVKALQRIETRIDPITINKSTGEVKGFLLKEEDAKRFCLKELIFKSCI